MYRGQTGTTLHSSNVIYTDMEREEEIIGGRQFEKEKILFVQFISSF